VLASTGGEGGEGGKEGGREGLRKEGREKEREGGKGCGLLSIDASSFLSRVCPCGE
jgi:hypothetical protein